MPPKSLSKKDQITWLLCEKCKIYITSKDRDKHGEDCSLQSDTNVSSKVNYSFIQNKQLFSTNLCEKADFTGTVPDELLNDLNNLVFVSESVINLCGWTLRDFVMLESSSQDVIPVVRRIWPIIDKNTPSVFVTNEGEIYFILIYCLLYISYAFYDLKVVFLFLGTASCIT